MTDVVQGSFENKLWNRLELKGFIQHIFLNSVVDELVTFEFDETTAR